MAAVAVSPTEVFCCYGEKGSCPHAATGCGPRTSEAPVEAGMTEALWAF